MNFDFIPFVRYASKNTHFIPGKYVVAKDCRLLYIISGNGTFNYQNKVVNLYPGTLVYYPYNMPYKIVSSEGMLFYTINFDFNFQFSNILPMNPVPIRNHSPNEVLESLSPALSETFSDVIHISNAHWAGNDLKTICDEALHKNSGFPQIQSAHLKIILINIHRHINKEVATAPICKKIKALVLERPDLNNKELAEQLNYHPFYLNQIFKEREGITLHKYIVKQRAIKAYELLTTSTMSLEEIAHICGFSSQAHLSTSFKSVYSISPSQLKKQF